MASLAKPLILKAVTDTPATRRWMVAASSASVMHVFEGAANLDDEQAGVLSLVAHPLGAGPFTLVVAPGRPQDSGPLHFDQWIDSTSSVHVDGKQLSVGRLIVMLAGAELWDPALPWERLKANEEAFLHWRGKLVELLRSSAPPGGFAPLLFETGDQKATAGEMDAAMRKAAGDPSRRLAKALAQGDIETAIAAAGKLAGLGGGLTPSGDDFVVGAIYALWLCGRPGWAESFSSVLASTAGARTTRISQAWLEAAAQGEASRTWHTLCDAILSGNAAYVERAAEQLLAVGHTSGADALTGFLMTLDAFYPS